MHVLSVDRHDLQLLDTLQRNSQTTNADLGLHTHLSPSQVSRRISRLEEHGVIAGYAARLDRQVLGLEVTAWAHVLLERHGNARPADFERAVAGIPEILDCHAVTGEADYILRIIAPDLATFSALMHQQLLTLPGIAQIRTNIALASIKESHALPLDHIGQAAPRGQRLRYAGEAESGV